MYGLTTKTKRNCNRLEIYIPLNCWNNMQNTQAYIEDL